MSDRGTLPRLQRPITRVVVGGVLGGSLVFWLEDSHRLELLLSLLVGWTVLAAVFVGWTWLALWWLSPVETKSHAEQEQPGHWAVVLLILIGAVASLGAIGTLLDQAKKNASGVPHGLGAASIAVGSVALSWLTIHTLYALIYAKHYFDPKESGGINFNSPPGRHHQPCFKDFFYVAFAIGMSFAIPDTNLTSTRMRTTALGQGLLSFVFGAVIIASVVNLLGAL